ncbi:hypothetical protein L2E82_15867 [Cichorium intybus]|uniref:Uncharacterized protein n=1 Tax=Cichorium intybus TaxID=13427 RepID=A0ACB9F580_CICIN|nr:hypothetical protein L2E82_15867 [Cichorium intybus]
MDVLVSVTCDEDLAAIVEEYDRVSPDAKIRAVLCPVRSLKTISPVPSFESLVDFSASKPPPHPVVGNSVVRKGTQHFQAVDFSAYKLPRYPLAGSCRDSPPSASYFIEQTMPRQNYVDSISGFDEGISTKCLLAPFQTSANKQTTREQVCSCQKVFWGFKNNLKNSSTFLPPHKKKFQHSQFCP